MIIVCVLDAVVSLTLCLPPLLSPLPRYVSQALPDMEEHGQRIFLWTGGSLGHDSDVTRCVCGGCGWWCVVWRGGWWWCCDCLGLRMGFGVVLGMRKKAGKELLSCRMGLKRYSIWIDHVWNLYCLSCGWLFLFYVLLWLFWRMDEDLCRVWGEEDGRSEMIDVLCVSGEI